MSACVARRKEIDGSHYEEKPKNSLNKKHKGRTDAPVAVKPVTMDNCKCEASARH